MLIGSYDGKFVGFTAVYVATNRIFSFYYNKKEVIFMKKDKNYVIVQFIGKDFIRIYRHYRHPITGTLANSGKKELIAVIQN